MRKLSLLPLLGLLAACSSRGSSSSSGSTHAGEDATAEQLCTFFKTANANKDIFSAAAERCAAGDPPPVFLESLPDGAARVAALRAECKPGDWAFDLFDGAIEGGRVRFDSERLSSCLAKGKIARATASPAIFRESTLDFDEDPDCTGIATPLVNEGGECVEVWDCPHGTTCEADDPGVDRLSCLKPAGLGAACGHFRTCDPSTFFCSEQGICTQRQAIGETCSFWDECAVGAYCPVDVCEPIPDVGEPCQDVCADGVQCVAGTCVPPPPPAVDGELCQGRGCSAPCSVCRPEQDGDTEAQFKCLSRAPAGGPCGLEDTWCAAGLYCNSATGHCDVPLVAGASCLAPGVRCGEASWCDDLVTGKCFTLPGLGGDCSKSHACEEGLYCSLDVCIAGEAGDRCVPFSGDCQSPLVCRGAPGSETCQPPPKVGQACPQGTCAEGAFCNAQGECEALRAVGAACDDGTQCKGGGDCYEGKCAPGTPSCGDVTQIIGPFLGMGVLGVLKRRKSRRRRE